MRMKRSERNEIKKQLSRKRHPFKYFNVLLFLFGLLLILNFNALVYAMHPDDYVQVQGTTIEQGQDPLLGIFPRTKFTYNYNGHAYEANKTLYAKMFFVADTTEGYPLYVNKLSPEDTIIIFPIHRSFLNLILVLLCVFCIWQIVLGIIKNHKRRKEKQDLKEDIQRVKEHRPRQLEGKQVVLVEDHIQADD